MQPPYSPNVVNQTVDFGGRKWRGQPGQGWVDITEEANAQAAQQQAQQAQDAYKQATGAAIGGLQDRQKSLPDQYAELLKTVKGQYDPLINQETATAGAALSRRGLTPDSQLFQQQVQGALQPIYGAQAANAQQIGAGSISDMNALAQSIAGLQTGVAGTASQLPLQFGSLALNTQLTGAQSQNLLQQLPTELQIAQLGAAKPFPVGNLVYNPSTRGFVIPGAGGGMNYGGGDIVTQALKTLSSSKNKRQPISRISQFVQA